MRQKRVTHLLFLLIITMYKVANFITVWMYIFHVFIVKIKLKIGHWSFPRTLIFYLISCLKTTKSNLSSIQKKSTVMQHTFHGLLRHWLGSTRNEALGGGISGYWWVNNRIIYFILLIARFVFLQRRETDAPRLEKKLPSALCWT